MLSIIQKLDNKQESGIILKIARLVADRLQSLSSFAMTETVNIYH